MSQRNRSPLKDKPLRNPGQSAEERLWDVLYDRLLPPFAIALFLLVMAGMEWWRYFFPLPPNPGLHTVVAALALGYAVFRLVRSLPEIRALRQGRDGERAVGQFLERLREKGYQVFHDVVGTGFNVDHILIGPAGIYTVETKTYSKPEKGDSKIVFEGETLLVNGRTPERNPIVQARAQARWLRELLAEGTGKRFPVMPVILFPGWFIEQGKDTTRDLWVLNPKALPEFLERQPNALAAEDVKLASFHLSRFIRTK
jgi:hypothetical protein